MENTKFNEMIQKKEGKNRINILVKLLLIFMIILGAAGSILLFNPNILDTTLIYGLQNIFNISETIYISEAIGIQFAKQTGLTNSLFVSLIILMILGIPLGITAIDTDTRFRTILKKALILLIGTIAFMHTNMTTNNILAYMLLVLSFIIQFKADTKLKEFIMTVLAFIIIPILILQGSYVAYVDNIRNYSTLFSTIVRYRFIENIGILILMLAVFYIIFRRRIGTILFTILNVGIVLGCCIAYQIRGINVTLFDLTIAGTALEVAGGYTWQLYPGLCNLILNGIIIIALFSSRCNRELQIGKKLKLKDIEYKVKWQRLITLIVAIPLIMYSTTILGELNTVEELANSQIKADNMSGRWNGYPFTFYTDYIFYKEDAPEDYKNTIKNIEEKQGLVDYTQDLNKITWQTESSSNWAPYSSDIKLYNTDISFLNNIENIEKPDHIVVILAEGYSAYPLDKMGATGFEGKTLAESNETLLPLYNSLKENTIKGYTYVSVHSGGTANTEYEVLTGLSNSIYSTRVYPYQTKINSAIPCLVSQAIEDGYDTIGMHTYKNNGYRREAVWNNIGIQDIYFENEILELNPTEDRIKDFIPDSVLYNTHLDLLNSKDKSFTWLVTMENHTGRKLTDEEYSKYDLLKIDIPDAKEGVISQLATTNHSEQELADYINELSKRDDKVMVVVYGDHQSIYWNNLNIYGEMNAKSITELSQYSVPFFIWCNYDIPEHENILMSTFYLNPIISRLAGLSDNMYNDYALNLYKQLPVITSNGCLNDKLEFTTIGEIRENTSIIKDLLSVSHGVISNYESELYEYGS